MELNSIWYKLNFKPVEWNSFLLTINTDNYYFYSNNLKQFIIICMN